MDSGSVKLEESWKNLLFEEFSKPYFQSLKIFLKEEKAQGYRIYPPGNLMFAALDKTPFDKVKAVIIGQDPYHGAGQANGLCFSVTKGIKPPPSLQNIFKERYNDLGLPPPGHGDLGTWAEQGVLLLNATLTVRDSQPGSHQNKGWEIFTDRIIQLLSEQKKHLVFILWGKFAQGKGSIIDSSKHLVLSSAHPSPFSAYNGFFGSAPFSKTNSYLISKGIGPLNF